MLPVDVELVKFIFERYVRVFFLINESMSNLPKMSNKKKKKSFFNKLRRIFKKKDKLEEQSEFCNKQEKVFDDRQTDHIGGASCSSDQKIAKAVGSEICVTVPRNSLSGKETHVDKNLSENCKNVDIIKSESFRFPNVNDDISEKNHQNVTKNKQLDYKLGSDRHMNTKITFLNQDNNTINSRYPELSLGDTGKVHHDNGTKSYSSDSKNAILRSLNDTNITSGTRKFLKKETKAISQESSEDSDFSADSTEDSFEDSSEDENEHPIKSKAQKYFKDEYFTKGKYITYFFLEMERQLYNPTDVYSMVQYHDTDNEKPGKKGTK